MSISIIVAVNNKNGIGYKGDLLYRLKKDMNFFKNKTISTKNINKKNAVIMGRNTWESIPDKFKPLADRLNIILTKNNIKKLELNTEKYSENVLVFDSLDNSLDVLYKMDNIENIFIIGGSKLYNEAINRDDCNKIYLTLVNDDCEFDTDFPKIDKKKFKLINCNETINENAIIIKDNIKKDLNIKFLEYSIIKYV